MTSAWSMDYYRTAVYGRFQHIASGQTVCMFNTHYETPGKTEAQNQASAIIIARMALICQATDKLTVLTGDLNAPPGESAIKKLFEAGLEEPSAASTFCGDMISPTCATKFDYTLHRVKDGACYKSSDVLRTPFGGCYTSDHAPLLGTFCLGGTCCGVTPPPTTVAPTPSPTPSPSSIPSSSPDASQNSSTAGNTTNTVQGSASNEENVIPGAVSAGKDNGIIGSEQAAQAGGATAASGAGAAAAAATPSPVTDAGTTQITTSNSSGGPGSSGTVMAVLGVVGAVGIVAVVVVRKKRALDARMDSEKSSLAPMPSYFTHGNRAGSEELSPLPRISEHSEFSRESSSPIPTLAAGSSGDRDSRLSSMSVEEESSTYSRSPSYDSRMQESRINMSEAFRGDSFDSDDGVLSNAHSDFAML